MKRLLLIATATLALGVLTAAPAQAAFGLNGFKVSFEEEGGAPASQAGSHPFAMETTFLVNTKAGEPTIPDQELKDLEVELPVGLAGNPTAVPTCSHADFLKLDPETSTPACPDDTAVGVVTPSIINPGFGAPRAVFNLQRPPGTAAEIGFVIAREPVTIDLGVKQSSPFNVAAAILHVPQAAKLFGSKLTIWGNPANPAHNAQRGSCIVLSGGNCPYDGGAEKPFLTLPRACTGPLFTTYKATSWQGSTDAGSSTTPLETSGCQALGFGPEIESQPTTSAAESASGLDFELKVDDPELSSPAGKADSDIKAVTATLPQGVTVNPSTAEGQAACSAAQLAAESLEAQGCPQASRLGTVEVETPLLEGEVLEGSLYLAAQQDNPFATLLALYVVVKDPALGVLIKQAGKVEPNLITGQLVSTFEGIPQLPFSSFRLHFMSGPRAPLITPATCGRYETTALLTPWAGGPALSAGASFEITSGCRGAVLPFGPTFTAGTQSPGASTYSPFDLRITRHDGEAELSRFSATLPEGVVGKLAGISECSEAAIAAARLKTGRQELAAPSCPASSLVGHTLAGAGVGSALTYVPGNLYLAGPYNGDPLSIVAITPAIAGPLDVGNVVVRVALTLDQSSAEVKVDSAASEPFPHILAGIPLRLRDLRVMADRPSFTVNATNCEPLSSAAQIFGLGLAGPLALSAPYQASGCGSLGFNPKLSLSLKGATKRSGHPALSSVVSYPYPSGPGYANIARAVVTLPPGEQIDNAHINNPCTRVQFNENACPANSVLGSAKAISPLLDKPLEGPVYFRSNGGEHLLPDIVADLKGQVNIVLVGHVDAVHARIRTSFENVPDAPVTKFSLSLFGGKRGLLVNNRDICASPQKAKLVLTAQNNRRRESAPTVKNSC